MPRPCRVCTSPDRDRIDAELVQGVPNRRIAAQFAIAESCIRRHAAHHLPATLTKAAEVQEVARAGGLLGQVRDLHQKTLRVLNGAEAANDHGTLLKSVRECRENLILLARLVGELRSDGKVNVVVGVAVAGEERAIQKAATDLLGHLLQEAPPDLRLQLANWLQRRREQWLSTAMRQVREERRAMGLEGEVAQATEPDPPTPSRRPSADAQGPGWQLYVPPGRWR